MLYTRSYLDQIQTEGLERVEDDHVYPLPGEAVLHLGHRDLKLGYFAFVQHRINDLTSGDQLILADDGCKNNSGDYVLKFSQKFMSQLGQLKQDGYILTEATVNFIVYWTDEKGNEVKIVLPELGFYRGIENDV